jgi:hypothetical protein
VGGEHRRADGAPAAHRDARRMRRGSTAKRMFGPMAAASAEAYARARDLPRLIALWPHELADESVEGCRFVLAKLRRALRAERRRASSGHWSYDLNRHVALVGAYKAELARLEREQARLSALEPVAAET